MNCRIADVEVLMIAQPSLTRDPLDGAAETIVVCIRDEEGRVGIGEADSASPAIRTLILMDDVHSLSRGLRNMLIGEDPFQIRALWNRLAAGTVFNGEMGIARHALAAVDIALHDLVGQQIGRPAFHLLGGAQQPHLTPYATLYAGAVGGRTLTQMADAMLTLVDKALAHGFRALKYEALFEDLASDRELVTIITEARAHMGHQVTLLLDFGYRWHDWRDALWTLKRLEACDLWLVEAVLQHHDWVSHGKLAERVEMRVGGAEFASSLQECRMWLEVGKVDVIQADVARAGGLTELSRIAELAALHGAVVVPHCWKTGINFAAARHLQASAANVPFIEMFAPGFFPSRLREELVTPEPVLTDGHLPLPTEPGLGIRLSEEALHKYRVRA